MISLVVALVVAYTILILYYSLNFRESTNSYDTSEQCSFSIIIPYRNEERYLPELLRCIEHLNYPSKLIEVILIDDGSKDKSKAICQAWKTKNPGLDISLLDNLNLARSPKKSAILTGLQKVKSKYILTTDADCLVPQSWLAQYNKHMLKSSSDLSAGSCQNH